jgi:GT2 family glycosyltransferase
MTAPSLSIVIPVWNGRRYLADCLDALLSQEYPDLQVIAVDNASSDGSADWIAEHYPQVRLIRNPSNLGFAGGCNAGILAARGEVVILVNQDTRVLPGWARALVAASQSPGVGVVGSKILYPDGRTIQHAGGWIERPLGLAHHCGQGEADAGQWDAPRQVEYVTGAAMAFRREVLDRVGLLDEGFWPGYFEDADFCLRAAEAGYEVRYEPQAVLTHLETTSLREGRTVARAYDRGRLRFLLKHTPPDRFLEEVVPAERDYQLRLAQGPGGDPLRMAYLETVPVAASLLPRRWRADLRTVDHVLTALLELYRLPQAGRMSLIPPLQEFEFRSTLPVIGPLVARLRVLWYGVAARWAIRHLIEQQEAINQQQDVYARSLFSLSREVARLIVGQEKDGGSGRED